MSAASRDYYEVLGVGRDVDTLELKRAFRASARRLHPDVSADPDADGKFRELADAYAVLSKPASRLLYDRFGYRSRGAWSPTVWTRPRRRESRAGDVAELELEFFEAARGGRRTVRYRSGGPCLSCGGSGTRRGGLAAACTACEGRGHVRESDESGSVRLIQLVKCEQCDGSGVLTVERCGECGGFGEAEADRESEVVIPSGVEDGTRIPLDDDVLGPQLVVRVRPQPPDSAAVRAAAALGLAAAVAFVLFLLFR